MLKKVFAFINCAFIIFLFIACEPSKEKFFEAIALENIDQVKSMIKGGADVDWKHEDFGGASYKENTLYFALVTGKSDEMIFLLLSSGAKAGPEKLSATDGKVYWTGKSALEVALIKRRNIRIIKELLENGAPAHCPGDSLRDFTLMTFAASSKENEIVKLMAYYDSLSMNQHDGKGRTPLSVALLNHANDTAKLLIEMGADVNLRAKCPASLWGELLPVACKPLDIAMIIKDRDMINLLVSKGATYSDGSRPPIWIENRQ